MSIVGRGPDGEVLALQRLEGERIRLESPVARAPGTPIRLSVAEMDLSGRVTRCRKAPHGFVVELRLTNLRRETREALSALLEGSAL